jgi:hypothetical protein
VQPDLYPTYWQVRAAKGNDGRIFSYRGEYESGKSYTGNAQMAQVVKVGAQYYYTDANAGTFSGVQPPNANYWTSYGANFESVATGLLLAEKALIAGMFFDNNRMTSPAIDSSGEPLIIIDGNTGYVKLTGQSVLRVPFKNLGRELSGQINLTLDTHFNYSGSASSSTPSIVLPLGERYNGVQCMIFNDGIGTINNPARTINVSAQGGFVCMIGGEYVSTSSIVLKPYELGIFVCTGYTWIYINPNNRPRKTKEIIACGIVTGSSSGASISNSFTIDGSSISVSRLNAGQYRVYTGLASSTYSPLISLTGIGYVSGGTANPIKATLTDSTSTYFQVDTSDDDSRNDGSFMFQIFG